MAPRNVAVLVGSLRKESFSRKLAHAFAEVAPPSLELKIAELGDLPMYNPDIDNEPPRAWSRFREEIRAADALLFITPEYNRSMPGALKNAIDVGSRPYGKGALIGKPGAVVSNSPGNLSGFGAHHHLRQCLVFLDIPVLQQPEVYLSGIDKKFDSHGKLNDQPLREFLGKFMTAFDDWITRVGPRT